MNIIRYEEIMDMLTQFETLKSENSSNASAANRGFNNFASSGVNIGSTGYSQEIQSKLSRMTSNSEVVQGDYDRIIRYLTKLAETARASANRAITTVEARDIWNATETVDG